MKTLEETRQKLPADWLLISISTKDHQSVSAISETDFSDDELFQDVVDHLRQSWLRRRNGNR